MTASVADQILARVLTVVQGVSGIAGAARNRAAAIGVDELPYANIIRGATESMPHAERLRNNTVGFDVRIYASGASYEQTLDGLHVAVDAALHADATLNTLGRGLIGTGTELEDEDAEYTCGRITARYQIHVLTRPGDLTRAIN